MQEQLQPNDLPGSDPLVGSGVIRKEIGGVSAPTLWRWIRQGKFPQHDIKVNNIRFWRWSRVLAWKERMLRENAA
jgi:predicted DNA-binding transcriptional regulator AlpA